MVCLRGSSSNIYETTYLVC